MVVLCKLSQDKVGCALCRPPMKTYTDLRCGMDDVVVLGGLGLEPTIAQVRKSARCVGAGACVGDGKGMGVDVDLDVCLGFNVSVGVPVPYQLYHLLTNCVWCTTASAQPLLQILCSKHLLLSKAAGICCFQMRASVASFQRHGACT